MARQVKESAYIFVGGIPFDLTESDILAVFCPRAANTGWGHQDKNSRWGHDKFEGSKRKERRFNDQEGFGLGNRNPSSREKGNNRVMESHSRECKGRDDKRMRRHDDDEIKLKSRDDHDKKQENRFRKQYEDDEFEPKARDNRDRREEKRPKQYDGSAPKSKVDLARREEKRSRENDGYDSRREERKFRRYDDGENEPRSREDYHMREEKKSRRHDDDEVEPRSRGEHDGKEETRSRRHESRFSLRGDQDQVSNDKWSNPEKDLSSHYRGERDGYQRRRDR
ncbi:RNA-binding motif protein, X-linked 2-like [Carica papaya]|uniref:RNA-binding motif protein, X-linked 2-like n=1 Tax=Carica papaya TaxID=3649 RepID=UPI000B8C76C1|nr:RNA-binding motif protein, X-linked 2-like [Carica papaya]